MNAPFFSDRNIGSGAGLKGGKGAIARLKIWWQRQMFIVSPLGVAINPSHIIRRGIYRATSRLAPQISGNVLDFGCGSKPYEELFTAADRYTGVDIEVSGHDHSDSKVDRYYDGKTLPFRDALFDSVVCFEVFEHVFNLDEVLAEIRRVMRPGGRLLLSIPFAWHEHEVPYDFARYTSFGFRHVLEKNGFEVVEVEKTTTSILAMGQLFIIYVHEHILPLKGVFSKILRLAVIFPLNLLVLAANAMLPKRKDFYSGMVVLARKTG